VIGALVPDKAMVQLRGRGARLRCVTEITADKMQYCREAMKYSDLYHMPSLTGNFVIIDGREYLGDMASEKGESKLLRARVPSFVAGQQFLFDNVIKNAAPARQRILEIVKGIEGEFMETVRDPARVKSLVLGLVNSAIYEVSVLFSTRNSFVLAEREGIIGALEALTERGVKVRILVMKGKVPKEPEDDLRVARRDVRVNYLRQFLPTKITTFVVDQAKSLVIEVNDDTKATLQEAAGLATYSNSESTVFSNTSMFESLWIQSELDKQSKTKQVYF
jgi:two-component system sensor histidine kinase VicK